MNFQSECFCNNLARQQNQLYQFSYAVFAGMHLHAVFQLTKLLLRLRLHNLTREINWIRLRNYEISAMITAISLKQKPLSIQSFRECFQRA